MKMKDINQLIIDDERQLISSSKLKITEFNQVVVEGKRNISRSS